MRSKLSLAALISSVVFFAPQEASAQFTLSGHSCSANNALTVMNPDALFCAGAFLGNNDGGANVATSLAQLATSFGGTGWARVGSTDDAGNGPFSNNVVIGTGTLNFDVALNGYYALGLKTSTSFSFYLFNFTNATNVFVTTAGVEPLNNQNLKDLSHATLYSVANSSTVIGQSVVPEPSTYALMGAGLLALGIVARRRRQS